MAQLQARYPNASLIAEFVTVHQEHLVVRALVQVGGVPLATGMAAATDIEQAEDRAKVRALAALGIGSITPSPPHQSPAYSIPSVSSLPTSSLSASPGFSTANLVAPDSAIASTSSEAGNPSHLPGSTDVSGISAITSGSSDIALPHPSISSSVPHLQPHSFDDRPQSEVSLSSVPESASPLNVAKTANVAGHAQPEFSNPESSTPEFDRAEEYEFSYEPEPDHPDLYKPEDYSHSEMDLISEPDSSPLEASLESIESPPPAPKAASSTKPASGKGKTTKRKSEPEIAEIAPSTAGESDRSEEIAKIGLEMKRLGWTTEQGRNYLKRTYGKRSRQELDDSELIDFLRYLEAQVSASESPF